jgi:hypothetical protein
MKKILAWTIVVFSILVVGAIFLCGTVLAIRAAIKGDSGALCVLSMMAILVFSIVLSWAVSEVSTRATY